MSDEPFESDEAGFSNELDGPSGVAEGASAVERHASAVESSASAIERDEPPPPTLEQLFSKLIHQHSRPLIESVSHRASQIATSPSELLPWLHSDDFACRIAAIKALGHQPHPLDPSIVDLLIGFARNDENVSIVCAAIEALGRQQITQAADVITECMNDGNEHFVPPAALALSRIGDPNISERLRYLLAYGNNRMVRSAAQGLSLLAANEALPDLIEALQQSPAIDPVHPRTKWTSATRKIIEAIGELKGYEAIDLLKAIASDHVGLRSPALLALHQLGEDITQLLVDAYQIKPTRNLHRVAVKTGKLHHVDDLPDADAFKRQLEVSAAEADPRLMANREMLQTTPELIRVDEIVSAEIEYVDPGFVILRYQGLSMLLPSYEIAWGRVGDACDLLTPGTPINVKVLSVDCETGKVFVSIRRMQPDPWVTMARRIPVGTRLHGEITGVTNYGVFVEVMPNIQGLVHRSQFPDHRIDLAEIGPRKPLSVIVAAMDERGRRITLHLPS
ncbi:HEAT repeat domain-containing protein [Stieleria varia]|uniref:30S ribosomal protein S1 n=1 Tax=Stieleria varia TaxID=2528005 RepID=A0A5C6AQ71_9BACT|nr:HEAT repeat domain-containing protein [Stieleria varia]TWU01132.1 30S ribosomal protein S1 [Stieleria varia]